MAESSEPTSGPEPRDPARDASRRATIAGHSGLECLLTCALVFASITVARWVVGPSPVSAAIPRIHLRLLIIGACFVLILAGLILSRPGKISGGHMNPAVSFAMWRFGVFPGSSVVSYIVAQLAGSLLGVLVGRAVWGPVVADPPVSYSAVQPGPGVPAGVVFLGEAVSMGVILYLIGLFLTTPRLARLIPWLVGFLIGAGIASLGTTTGASLDPARQFGPAVISGQLDFLWIYLLAPMVGAAVAAAVFNLAHRGRTVLTHRLCGTKQDGSPLEGQRAPAG
jgi:glycerol uptake facilitator-like aquaporin